MKENRNYESYEVQNRKWSPNALVGVFTDESGAKRREVIMVPCNMPKAQGDALTESIKSMLENGKQD